MTRQRTARLPDRLPADVRPEELGLKVMLWKPEDYASLMSMAGRKQLVRKIERERRWVGYGRYSTLEQDPDSLKRQFEACAPFWQKDDNVLVRWEADAGRTGTTMYGRKGLERVLAAVRREEFDALIIEDVDRLARNVGQLMLMYEEMQQHGVELWDCKHGKLEWLQVYTLGLIAELGRNRIVEVTSGGRRMAIKRGRIMNKLIFGYMNHKVNKRFRVVDPALKDVVIWVFERIAEGATPWQVAKDLCAKYRGPRPAAGKSSNPNRAPYDEKFVRRMITNPLYMGFSLYERDKTLRDFATKRVKGRRATMLGDQTIVEVPHFEIVTKNLWARANLKLSERARGTGGGGGSRVGAFSGRVHCECGAPTKRHGPPDRRTFQCTSHIGPAVQRCDHKGGWPVAWLEAVVLDKIAELVDGAREDARLRMHVERMVAEAKAHDRRARADMLARRAAIRLEEKRLWDPLETIGMPKRTLARMRTELGEEDEAIIEALATAPDPSEFDAVLEELESVEKAVAAMRKRVPFVVGSAEDQGYVEILRDVVREITLCRTAALGVTRIKLRLRIGEPLSAEEEREEANPQLSFMFDGAPGDAGDHDYLIDFEAEAFDTWTSRRDAIAERRAREAALAETGMHDVSARIWSVVKPLLADVDFARGDDVVAPRRVFDAVFFALKTGVDWEALPARYGRDGAVYRILKRMARCGSLDRALEALQAKAPKALAGLDLDRLRTSRFPRSNAALAPGRGAGAVKLGPRHVAELLAAASGELNDPAKMRMLAVARRIEGEKGAAVAARFGISGVYVSNLVAAYRARGLPALRAGKWNQPPSVFTPKVFVKLRKFVAKGFDPADPRRPLTLKRVNAYAKELGVDVSIEHLGRKLNGEGISLQGAIAAARLDRSGGGAS